MGSETNHDHTCLPAWLGTVRRRVADWLDEGVGRGWVVAVSGGGDSVGMLQALLGLRDEFGLRLSVAHLDHGARGEAARRDARFVAELAESLELPFDLGVWRPTRAGHFEADARRARLEWLAEIAAARGASVVAVGHTRDDQAETILHRIVRGTGTRGLAGMPARRALAPGVELVRPLLEVGRGEVREELVRTGREFREDASNGDRRRTRARIRGDLIPRLMADYNPEVVAAVVRLGETVAAERRLLETLMAPIAAKVVRSIATERIVFDRRAASWLLGPAAVEIVRGAWRVAGWPEGAMSASRWRRLAAGLMAGARVDHLGEGARLRPVRDALLLERGTERRSDGAAIESIALHGPGAVRVPWTGGTFEADSTLTSEPFEEVVDWDRVAFPLIVRTPEPDERFDPLGMKGKRQRVTDFLRMRGVPREDRATAPVVVDREGVVWVVGHRIADRVKTTARTRRRLSLRWRPDRAEVDAWGGLS